MKLCLSLLMSGVLLTPALAAEQPARGGLEDYLKLLHYKPVAYKSNDRNRPLLEGEINGDKLVFLVDTGCAFTMLSPASASGLKSLGELGVVLEDSLLGKLTNADIVLMDKLTLGKEDGTWQMT